jgi:hypothetical protein
MSSVFALISKPFLLFPIVALALTGIGCDKNSKDPGGPVMNAPEVSSEEPMLADATPPAGFRDFSKSNAVTLLLAEETGENGLKHNFREKDGLTTIVKVGEIPCRLLNMKETRQEGYLYFTLDPAFKKGEVRNVRIDVEYFDVVFDDSPSTFGIHYDGTGLSTSSKAAYKSANKSARLGGSNTWQVATFHLRDASFNNAQNGRSDFRISVKPPELYVRRVTVTRENQRNPISFIRKQSLPVEGKNAVVTP